MFKSEYDQIIRENFNLSDNYTRQYIASLEEGSQEQLLAALSSALYDKIIANVDDIDFGTIPQSRGDITKVQGFEKTEQCMDIIRKLVIEYKQKTDVIDTVITATSNIKDRKSTFMKGFAINSELHILVYNLMVLSIERSVSLLIATCIQFIKDPNSSTPKTALDKVAYQRTMDDMLYKQLESFNTMCKNKSLDKILDSAKGSVKESITVFDVDSIGLEKPEGMDNPFGDDNVEPFEGENEPEPEGFDPAEDVPTIPAPNPETPPVGDEFPEDVPSGPVPDVSDIINDDEDDDLSNDSRIAKSVIDMLNSDNDTEDDKQDMGFTNDKPPIVSAAVFDIVKNNKNNDCHDDNCPEETNDSVEPSNIPYSTEYDNNGTPDAPINETETKPHYRLPGILDAIGAGAKKVADKIKQNPNSKKILAVTAITAAIAAAPFIIVKVLIPGIRYLVYLFYYTTMKLSDYLDIQATLIEANANELENSTDSSTDEAKKKKTIEKQRKWADRLHKWSNKFAIDHKTASNKAKSQSNKDQNEKKTVQKDEDGDDSIF